MEKLNGPKSFSWLDVYYEDNIGSRKWGRDPSPKALLPRAEGLCKAGNREARWKNISLLSRSGGGEDSCHLEIPSARLPIPCSIRKSIGGIETTKTVVKIAKGMGQRAYGRTFRIAGLLILKGVSKQGWRKIQESEFKIQEEKTYYLDSGYPDFVGIPEWRHGMKE